MFRLIDASLLSSATDTPAAIPSANLPSDVPAALMPIARLSLSVES